MPLKRIIDIELFSFQSCPSHLFRLSFFNTFTHFAWTFEIKAYMMDYVLIWMWHLIIANWGEKYDRNYFILYAHLVDVIKKSIL